MITLRNVLLGLALFLTANAMAFRPVSTTNDANMALDGFDVVAYFDDGKAIKGEPWIVVTWQGAKWCFVSEKNRKAFQADPEAYAPQYGGYCALGVAKEDAESAEDTPMSGKASAFVIYQGKLYVFHNPRIQAAWQDDPEAFIATADAHWERWKRRNFIEAIEPNT